MEASVGNTAGNGTTFTWTVNHMNEWDLTPKCFYTNVNNKQCCSNLAVTVYQPPENVSFSLNHTGLLTKGAEVTLQCSVLNVAPAENLTVTFYRGQTPLGHMTTNSSAKKPVSETFSLSYNTSKEDNGAEFWCEAKLELGAEGPQPPLVVKSDSLTTTVYYGPELKVPAVPAPISIIRGETLHLTCLAEGNPNPLYNWTLPSNKGHRSVINLTIESVDFQDGGQYVCAVSNKVKTVNVTFNVKIQENILPYIIVAIVAAMVLLLIGSAVFYIFYYKKNKMGEYRLKDVFRLGTVHHTAVPLSL
ncbi:vascular cell adhesion protein 1-like [Anableps anableps]